MSPRNSESESCADDGARVRVWVRVWVRVGVGVGVRQQLVCFVPWSRWKAEAAEATEAADSKANRSSVSFMFTSSPSTKKVNRERVTRYTQLPLSIKKQKTQDKSQQWVKEPIRNSTVRPCYGWRDRKHKVILGHVESNQRSYQSRVLFQEVVLNAARESSYMVCVQPKRDVLTWWNSTFYILERFLRIRELRGS